jgi:hypothetical protein
MRALNRILLLVLLLVGTLPGSAVAKTQRPLVLHPTWHRVTASNNVEVLTTGRYAYIGATRSGLLIDVQIGRRVNLTPPTGYYVGVPGNGPSLGGSWVMATCDSYAVCESSPTYQLYSIPAGTWTPLQQPDLSTAGGYGWVPDAIGGDWIEWTGSCGYHCGPTTFAFQSIQTGQVDGQPPDWKASGTEVPDLNSPALTHVLCAPLTVPHGFTDPTTGQTLPGTIVFSGSFAVAQQWSAANLNLYTYLERCGSSLHELLTPRLSGGSDQFAINQDAVVWGGYQGGPVHGVFLKNLRKFTIPIPKRLGSTLQGGSIFLTSRTMYLESGSGQVMAATSPKPPKR